MNELGSIAIVVLHLADIFIFNFFKIIDRVIKYGEI